MQHTAVRSVLITTDAIPLITARGRVCLVSQGTGGHLGARQRQSDVGRDARTAKQKHHCTREAIAVAGGSSGWMLTLGVMTRRVTIYPRTDAAVRQRASATLQDPVRTLPSQ